MKMKKITIILIAISLIVLPIAVYGAYTSIKNIVTTASSGTISIDTDSKNFIIYTYDDPATVDQNEETRTVFSTDVNNTDYAIANGRISCYATRIIHNGYEENYIQLNQLGLQFEFTNTIDVYVRVRIEDSWISTKLYRNGTVREQVILKDTTAFASALGVDSNWKYDAQSGYIYYKLKIDKSDVQHSLEIKFDSDYFYNTIQTTSYTESVAVTLSYEIDIVQANRAEKKWNVDLDEIIG